MNKIICIVERGENRLSTREFNSIYAILESGVPGVGGKIDCERQLRAESCVWFVLRAMRGRSYFIVVLEIGRIGS